MKWLINICWINIYSINECVFLKRRLAQRPPIAESDFPSYDTVHPTTRLNVLCLPTKRARERSCLILIDDQGEKNQSQFKGRDYVMFFIGCWPSYLNQKYRLIFRSQEKAEDNFPCRCYVLCFNWSPNFIQISLFFYLMFFFCSRISFRTPRYIQLSGYHRFLLAMTISQW